MARIKNAKTKYFVAEIVDGAGEPVWKRLSKWITNVSDDGSDNTEEQGDYDGDGNEKTVVLGYSEAYTFEGTHDREDAAQNLIVAKRRTPESRGIMFKIEIPDTETAIGKATVSEIKGSAGGGDATEFPAFGCRIAYDETPTVTKP
ncbi:phage tail protein [Listeria monocytogenes]|nr:phage tail protein [Listeria monocytogenes]ECJ9747533.1 phage tail protein [Listeria monocytogenes]EEO4442905.1 phage tail protein [Listeria monocytogenes]EIA7151921.1 phage tail protein [Listeria monocytogenes]